MMRTPTRTPARNSLPLPAAPPARTPAASPSTPARSLLSLASTLAFTVTLALASGPPVAAQTQTATVQGRVTDAATGLPLAGALVSAAGGSLAAMASAEGAYRLAGLPPGEHLLTAVRAGYAPQERRVTVPAGQTLTVDFALQPAAAAADPLAGQRPAAEVLRLMHQPVAAVAHEYAALRAPGRFNRESYAHTPENDFQLVDASPLSTFSIDVDRASYANVRRFIQSGTLPPPDAVRIEEMINYFPYDWSSVRGEHPFAVSTEVATAPWNREHHLVRIGLHAEPVETENLPPGNLVFLLDVSGSMDSPDKLPLLKSALALLVDQLRPRDRVSVVVYAGAAGLVLDAASGDEKERILAALEELRAGGSTAGGQGIELAYRVARENMIDGGNNRVILATDGDFNVGASSDGEMVRLIERERASGVFLTVLGFGTGNLQDAKMEQIADHGNGNFHYVDGLLEARKVLVEEMGGTLLTLAGDVKLQVEFNPARVAGYRLIGYENRLLTAEDFNDDTRDAGELGAGHRVTALYEVVPRGVEVPGRDVDPLRYQVGADATGAGPGEPGADDLPPSEFAGELMYVKVRYKDPGAASSKLLAHAVPDRQRSPSTDFRFATAVAGFGMLLRESAHAGDLVWDDVIGMAEGARGDDPRGYRGEFIRLVETARDIKAAGRER